jgi:hypothetical protein
MAGEAGSRLDGPLRANVLRRSRSMYAASDCMEYCIHPISIILGRYGRRISRPRFIWRGDQLPSYFPLLVAAEIIFTASVIPRLNSSKAL